MEHPLMYDEDDPVLAALRERVLALPGVVETITFGRPWWRAGKVFAIYGGGTRGPEKVAHPKALLVLVDPDELPARQQDPRFFVPAYFGPKGWLGIDLDGPGTVPTGSAGPPRNGAPEPAGGAPWTEVEELLDAAFRCAAPRRLLAELDARG